MTEGSHAPIKVVAGRIRWKGGHSVDGEGEDGVHWEWEEER